MSLGKVFLCHSSLDKGYVEEVALRLGRTKVAYDKLSFTPGQDFREEILKYLEESSLFVFFASENSIKSYWCKFELNQAEKLKMKGTLRGSLAILIDRKTEIANIPRWMLDLKAVILPACSAAVREIEASLFALTPSDIQKPFVGRTELQTDLQASLGTLGNLKPRMIVLGGLEGIGRKSYLEYIARNFLSMRFGPVIHIDETTGLQDIYLALIDETRPPLSVSELSEEINSFTKLSEADAYREVASLLNQLCELNHFPCFVDNGGILEPDGSYRDIYENMFIACLANPISYFGVTHRRKPIKLSTKMEADYKFQFVGALKQPETLVLLNQLLRRRGAASDIAEPENLLDVLNGYPPAVQVAANYIAEYGLDVLQNSRHMLVDFSSKRFLPFLQQIQINAIESSIIKYLASEQTMSLEVISIALAITPEETAVAIKRLIDINIVVNEDNKYAINGPLKDSITRMMGQVSDVQYGQICDRLSAAFWSGGENQSAPSLDVIDATLHAGIVSERNKEAIFFKLVRPSTIHRTAKEAYHQKKYAKAEQYAIRAIEMEPDRWQVLVILIKSLIQQEKYSETEKNLQTVGKYSKKIEYYLRGFMCKKRYNRKDAIHYFELAIQNGDDSISVYRDLADSLYRDGRISEAVDRITKARNRMRDNPYILDLAIKIYIDARMPDEASQCLQDLQKCDLQGNFINHCKARLLAESSNYPLAYEYAQKACEIPSPPFEAFAKKIDIMMHLRMLDEAWQELDKLEERFPRVKRDVIRGLRCKCEVLKGNWKKAQSFWDDITDKHIPSSQGLLRMILDLKSKDINLLLAERQRAMQQAQTISINFEKYDLGTLNDDEVFLTDNHGI